MVDLIEFKRSFLTVINKSPFYNFINCIINEVHGHVKSKSTFKTRNLFTNKKTTSNNKTLQHNSNE